MHTIYVSVSGGQLSVQPPELIEDNVTITDKDALVVSNKSCHRRVLGVISSVSSELVLAGF
jgi:hypothetical protein